MNKEVAQKWVDALRSGRYEQTDATLTRLSEDGNTHCCLGVLCELAVEDGVPITISGNKARHYDGRSGMPPEPVYDWSGLDRNKTEKYASMNDTDKASFDEIASAIENDNNLKKGGE